ncbi:MAG: NAD(P)H-binding protein [Bacillota bacterium]|nr:NAD(P)H-binding protein [Bacillota bacterium]
MKIVLAGAFGNLGAEILKELVRKEYEVVAADLKEREIEGIQGKYTFFPIDVTNPDSLKGLCDGADVLITTVGLTGASTKVNSYDIDYQGNINLYREAQRAKVKKFNYISVIACDLDEAKKVPMLDAKRKVEMEIQKGNLDYVIYRPTGYFYDILKVFKPYIEKGEMQLLKGYGNVQANVVDCPEFAQFIVEHMCDINKVYEVGGKETYTYEQMAYLCFQAANKECRIKYYPKWMFNILANLPKIKKAGKHDIILFSQFTLSHDLVGSTKIGNHSFKQYIFENLGV